MNKRSLAENLAASLALAEWSQPRLEAVLQRRLPAALHDFATPLSKTLYTNATSHYAPSTGFIAAMLLDNSRFMRIYSYCKRLEIWPDPDLTVPQMAPTAAFAGLDLPELPNIEALADWVSTSPERLRYFADPSGRHEDHGETAVNHYHYYLRKKSSGGDRLIEAPKQTLKAMQRRILRGILDQVPTHQDAFGFVRDRTCIGAASRHAGEEIVMCFDLQNFFPSIHSTRVFGLFRCLGYPHQVARHLTGLCTTRTPSRIFTRMSAADTQVYRHIHLPQGAPTSPSLANQIAYKLDLRLSGIAASVGAHYSRYADDITFSGDRGIAQVLLHLVPKIIHEEGFQVNPNKTRLMSQGSRQMVTGMVVNQHLNVPRKQFDRLKAIIHACGKSDASQFKDAAFRAQLLGQIAWVEAVNPSRGLKLRRLLARAVANPQT